MRIVSVFFLVASLLILFVSCSNSSSSSVREVTNQPNVIFFSVDDMNDWVGPLGYAQAKTPNMDRLAKSGMVFTNAHAPGVFCAPSRTAIWTGMHASTTGCYGEDPFQFDHPDIFTMQMAFKQGGYNTYGAGKLYHHRGGFVDLRSWDDFYSRSQEMRDMGWEMNGYHMTDVPLPTPYPYSPYYTKTDREISSAGHLEWGPIPNEQEDDMVDAMRTNWMCDVIKREHDKPFFVGLGMYSPHYPNYAPQKYFDLYNRDSIQLPPLKADDLNDLPEKVRKRMMSRSEQHQEIVELGAYKDAVLAYLASISFADAMLGRILDALEESPYKENTIIVFWSDQGFHHGEKGHWGKHTLWQRTTQVPFIWAGKGIAKNERVGTTVSLIDMYPTFIDLCNLSEVEGLEGTSLASILHKPSSAKDRNVYIPYMEPGSYAVVNMNWRYICYNDNTEELYNVKDDPNEWNNLADDEKYRSIMDEMKKSAPSEFAPPVTSKKDLNLVIDGNSFHWEKKEKK